MDNGRAWHQGRLALVAVALLGLVATPNVSAGTVEGGAASLKAAQEADGVKLQALADSNGALGVYWDEGSDDYVVVVPSSGESRFASSLASELSVSVRVETRDIDRLTIERISEALEAIKPNIKGHGYGFGFDPESGTMIVRSEAPESAFAAIENAFPGRISFRSGVVESTSRCSDTQPYSGGACLNGAKDCTSGFALDFNAGGRYMVTAGHCDPNGTTTNMGTAWREAEAYPYAKAVRKRPAISESRH